MMKKYAATESKTACKPTAMPAVMNPANVARELNSLTKPNMSTITISTLMITRRITRN
jgi:hypothetical protein